MTSSIDNCIADHVIAWYFKLTDICSYESLKKFQKSIFQVKDYFLLLQNKRYLDSGMPDIS